MAASISLLLDIGQGAGLAGASGVRPFLPPLLAGALARGDIGVDYERGPFAFLESPAFLLVILLLAVGLYVLERRRPAAAVATGSGAADPARSPVDIALLALGAVLGALLFAGSLSEAGVEWWPGLVGGALCAALGYAAVAGLLGRARRRVDASVGALLILYAEAFALLMAGLSILFPPLALVGLALFVVLLVRGRGSRDQKFQGLRILR
ncbi:MAG: hypothetical protein ACR2KD_03745 [Thermoleophilaceae bacterium]